MKNLLVLISIFILSLSGVSYASANLPQDVYLIFYATLNGESGHVGIAIDKYYIRIKDGMDVEYFERYDTVASGYLTYYDLWPKNEYYNKSLSNSNVEARYCKLPRASWEDDISLQTIYYKGIPQNKGYPCDGIIRIKTAPWQDYDLIEYLDSIVIENPPFNVRNNNCADFAEQAIEYLTGKEHYILLRQSCSIPQNIPVLL